ncbi:MAG: hypothetical protein SXA11_22295, partial [Cyanobacteriota bacterium]|nr:hypothetical protein [Cyanobacteriota bacterium]
ALAIDINKSLKQKFVVIALAIDINKSLKQKFVVIALAIDIDKSLKRLLQASLRSRPRLLAFGCYY